MPSTELVVLIIIVALGLEQKLIAVPIEALRSEVATIVRATVTGLRQGPL